MVNLHEKARKEVEQREAVRRRDLERNGFTIFYFDFRQRATFRNLSLGDAFRKLQQLTGYKVSFWRCPMRGLATSFQSAPKTSYLYDQGETYRLLHFSALEDETAAKKDLVLDVLLSGIGLYRGLPNAVFDEQVDIVKALLIAPPSIDRAEWLAHKAKLYPYIARLLDTHEADLRQNLLCAPGYDIARSPRDGGGEPS